MGHGVHPVDGLPGAGAFQPVYGGADDAFVAEITPSGALAWASYFGGSGQDRATAIATDASGNAWVAGTTYSADLPTPGGFQQAIAGHEDAFVAQITPSGTLAWASYLGGGDWDGAYGIATDSAGSVWVTGNTSSSDFPAPGGFKTTTNTQYGDAFVARITSSGTLAWATYLGGIYEDEAFAIATDASGNAWVTGPTESPDFPVLGAFQGQIAGDYDVFVAEITPQGALAWASYLGGSDFEWADGIACDSTGNAWVTGSTSSADFPTPGGFQSYAGAVSDAFIARITPSGALDWATCLGGNGQENGYAIAVDSSGNAWVTGTTGSPDFPVPGGFHTSYNGELDAFLARITPAGTLAWASFLGGDGATASRAVAIDPSGNIWLTGDTGGGFPTPGGFDTVLSGYEAFVVRIGFLRITTTSLPAGSVRFHYYQLLNTSGATPPCTWAIVSGSLPAGLSLNATQGSIGGIARAVGTFNFTVRVTDSTSPPETATQALSLTVGIADLTILTTSLAGGIMGNPYDDDTLEASGGLFPFVWSISAGSLPAGLSIDATSGEIAGTPTAAGTSNFTVTVTDSQSPAATATKAFSIVVLAIGPLYQFAASDTETSTTNTNYVVKTSLTFTPPGADDWIIFGFCEFKCPNVNYATFVQLFIDGVGEGQNTRKPVDPTDYLPFISVKVKALSAGPHTLRIMYRAGNSSAAAYVRNARICAIRKSTLEFWNVANDNAKALTINSTDIAVLTWTPAYTGNYLVISTAELNATTTVSTDLQTLYNGVVNDEGIMRAADNGDYTTFMSFNYLVNAPAAVPIAHKITGRKMATDPTNHYIRRARILALRLTGNRLNDTAAGFGTQQSTTQTTWQQCMTTTWTFGVSGKWLFLNSARLNNSSTNRQTEVRVQLNDSAVCGDQLMRPKHTTDLLNYSSIDIRALTTPRKVDMDYRTTNSAGIAMVKRMRFYGLPLDAQ